MFNSFVCIYRDSCHSQQSEFVKSHTQNLGSQTVLAKVKIKKDGPEVNTYYIHLSFLFFLIGFCVYLFKTIRIVTLIFYQRGAIKNTLSLAYLT